MGHPIDLVAAAQALIIHFGSPLAASRQGGEHRFAAVLGHQFDVAEPDARAVVAALVRRQALHWIAEPGLLPPCPSILELCGQWRIDPDRMQAL